MSQATYSLVNNETGDKIDLPLVKGTLGPAGADVGKVYDKQGLFTYDPGFTSTCSTKSAITYIDGDEGVLLYRGYPVDQLAEHSSFIEVCYLVLHGELPTAAQLAEFDSSIRRHTMINESLKSFFDGFHYDAHPMAMLTAVVGSLSAFYHDTTNNKDPKHREIFAHRMIAKIPTITAAAFKKLSGQPFMYPQNQLDYCSNLLHMMFAVPAEPYQVDPVAAKALDVLFILHADHEQNASTSTVRMAGSTGCNPYAAIASGIAALWGPLHGGANEAVLTMLDEIGDAKHVPDFMNKVKNKVEAIACTRTSTRAPRSSASSATRCSSTWARKTIRRWSWRSSSKRSRSTTTTSSSASSTRTSTSTPASSTRRSASRSTCSRRCSPWPAPWAGARTGWK
jgi:citrate synthase